MRAPIVLVVVLAVFLSSSVAVVGTAGASPTDQGSFELGGDVSMSFTSVSYDGEHVYNNTLISFTPRFGYFVVDNLELTLDLTSMFSGQSLDEDVWGCGSDCNSSSAIFGIGGSIVFHLPLSEKLYGFVGAGGHLLVKSDSDDSNYEPALQLPVLSGGLRYFVSDHAALNGGMYYSHVISESFMEDLSSNNIALRGGISIFF